MKKINNIIYLIFCLQVTVSWAQGNVEIRNAYERTKRTKPTGNNLKVAPITRSLPFFDNFMVSDTIDVPSSEFWYNDGGVKISNGMTKKNIDYNVAVFDGTDSSYIPYNSFENALKRGITDSLVSQYIDLSQLNAAQPSDTSKLYLTFFVQNGGYGEVADGKEGDQFNLSFKDKQGQWKQVWVRKDSVPNVADTLLLDRGFADFFKNVYKPVRYINTSEDSVNFVKKVYPLLANFSRADKALDDSLDYFFSIWPGAVDFNKNPSRTDSLDLYRKVYRNDPNYEANYKSFFKNIYHKPLNFNNKADSLGYFKKIYPYELLPEDYYKIFFGKSRTINSNKQYRELPVLYKDFSYLTFAKPKEDSVKVLYKDAHKDTLALKIALLRKLLRIDSLKHYRGIVTKSFIDGGYNEFTRYDYVFDKESDTTFFHPNFQMAFVSYGRQSGSFDIWGLDYVFLRMSGLTQNKIDRGIIQLNDKTLAAQLPSVFAEYSSLPWGHFSENTPLTDSISVSTLVLLREERLANVSPSVVFGYFQSGSFVELLSKKEDDMVNDGYRLDTTYTFVKPNIVKTTVPQTIETMAFLRPDSNAAYQVSYKNDAIIKKNILDNYYAYDDGAGERAFEISGRYSELAYRFDVEPGVKDTLTQLRIYFPKIISSNDGKSFSVKIWKRISKPLTGRIQDSVCYVGTKTIKYSEAQKSLGGFVEFNIDSLVILRDSFYVGFELLSADPIYVGYDLNSTLNSSRKILYNVDGDWKRFGGAAGNLMVRPVFGKYQKSITTREGWGDEAMDYQVYPNPVVGGEAMIKGEMPVKLRLFDLMGKEHSDFSYDQNLGKIDVSRLKSGIYTLKIIGLGVVVYKKIIVN